MIITIIVTIVPTASINLIYVPIHHLFFTTHHYLPINAKYLLKSFAKGLVTTIATITIICFLFFPFNFATVQFLASTKLYLISSTKMKSFIIYEENCQFTSSRSDL